MLQVTPHDVLQRGRGEEELLPQPQFLPRRSGIRRVEHPRDRSGAGAFLEGADMVA